MDRDVVFDGTAQPEPSVVEESLQLPRRINHRNIMGRPATVVLREYLSFLTANEFSHWGRPKMTFLLREVDGQHELVVRSTDHDEVKRICQWCKAWLDCGMPPKVYAIILRRDKTLHKIFGNYLSLKRFWDGSDDKTAFFVQLRTIYDDQPPIPSYNHDCDSCHFLGTYREADLYFCDQANRIPTVIARHSDRPDDYTSGLAFAAAVPIIGEAARRAVAYGWITEEEIELNNGGRP